MTMCYLSNYLEDFEKKCTDFLEHQSDEVQTISELFKPEMYERSQSEYEIKITSSVFYEKLGKHVETREIL